MPRSSWGLRVSARRPWRWAGSPRASKRANIACSSPSRTPPPISLRWARPSAGTSRRRGRRAAGHLLRRHGRPGPGRPGHAVRKNLAEHPISRVGIDSLAELVLADREWDRFPAYMRSLVGLVRAADVSLLATSETTGGGITAQSLEGLMFLFDNVIDLRYIEQESVLGRALNVVKMRNRPHRMTLNSAAITDQGLVVGTSSKGSPDGSAGARCEHRIRRILAASASRRQPGVPDRQTRRRSLVDGDASDVLATPLSGVTVTNSPYSSRSSLWRAEKAAACVRRCMPSLVSS